MDDLSVLQAVRAAEPGPSAAETTAARNALLTAIDAADQSTPVRHAGPRPAIRRTARPRVWIPVVAAAATIAVGAGALMLVPGGSRHEASRTTAPRQTSPGTGSHQVGPVPPVYKHATLTATVVLEKAAATAARQGSTTGKYFFTETESITAESGPDPGVYRIGPYLGQNWFGNGVDGRLVRVVGGRGRTFPVSSSSSVGMTWAQLKSLPTAPGPLLAVVARNAVAFPKSQNSAVSGEFEFIQELLLDNPIPPAVQAALYRVAAGLPGIKAVDTTDLVGRPAVEVYVGPGRDNAPAAGQALYFSPVTFQLLGEAVMSDAANVGCPVGWSSAILASGYVSSDTRRPAGTPTSLEPAYYSNSAPGCPTLRTGVPPWAEKGQADERHERSPQHH